MTELPMADERAERCETCRFFACDHTPTESLPTLRSIQEFNQEPIGECRRGHPAVSQGSSYRVWPRTWLQEWCGEWRARPVALSGEKRTTDWWFLESGLSTRAVHGINLYFTGGHPTWRMKATWSVADLAALTDKQLLAVKNVGQGTLLEIRQWLVAHAKNEPAPASSPGQRESGG